MVVAAHTDQLLFRVLQLDLIQWKINVFSFPILLFVCDLIGKLKRKKQKWRREIWVQIIRLLPLKSDRLHCLHVCRQKPARHFYHTQHGSSRCSHRKLLWSLSPHCNSHRPNSIHHDLPMVLLPCSAFSHVNDPSHLPTKIS